MVRRQGGQPPQLPRTHWPVGGAKQEGASRQCLLASLWARTESLPAGPVLYAAVLGSSRDGRPGRASSPGPATTGSFHKSIEILLDHKTKSMHHFLLDHFYSETMSCIQYRKLPPLCTH